MKIRVCLASGQELKRLIFTEKWDDEVSMASLTRCVQRRAAPSRALPPAPSRCHPLGRAAQAAASAGAAQRGVDLVAALQDVEQLALQEKRTCKGVSTAPG